MTAFPCEHCNLVYYSKSALTRHINDDHWDIKNEEDEACGE